MRVIFLTRYDPIRERPLSSFSCTRTVQEIWSFSERLAQPIRSVLLSELSQSLHIHMSDMGWRTKAVHMPSNSTVGTELRFSLISWIHFTYSGRNQILTRREQSSSGSFFQEVQHLNPIAQFTRNIVAILFHPQ
ncbi:hypothetical protein TNCV_602771 [Trichonephila clavipes]|nr:hypothetical protein TNCV_602771 [Trichonephila clavipes]